jgi:hypothetical protein
MGNGASVPVQDTVAQVVGDAQVVTRAQCRALSAQLGWLGDIGDWTDDVFPSSDAAAVIPIGKLLSKLEKEREKEADHSRVRKAREAAQKAKGDMLFATALAAPGVDGLSALPETLRNGIVPRDTEEVRPRVCVRRT